MDKPIHLAPHTTGDRAGKPRTAARRLHQLVSSPKSTCCVVAKAGGAWRNPENVSWLQMPPRAWGGIAWRGLGMSGPPVLKQKDRDEMFPQVEHCPEDAPWALVLL